MSNQEKIGFLEGRQWVVHRGLNWWIHPHQFIDATMLSYGAWEPPTTRVYEGLLGPDMVVLDLGANTGYFSILGARLVGPKGRVIAVEAMAEPLEVLKSQVTANHFANVKIIQAAVDAVDHAAEDFFTNYSWTVPGVLGATIFSQHGGVVPFKTVDTIVKEEGLERLDFVKIDLDGYDFRALRGAQESLMRFRPKLLVEVGDYTMRDVEKYGEGYRYGDETRRMLAFLKDCGYRLLREESMQPITDIEALLKEYDLSIRSINVVAVP